MSYNNLSKDLYWLLNNPDVKLTYIRSNDVSNGSYSSILPKFVRPLKDKKKGVVVVGNRWVYGLIGNKDLFDVQKLVKLLTEIDKETQFVIANEIRFKIHGDSKVEDILEFMCFNTPPDSEEKIIKLLNNNDFVQCV